MASLKIAMDQAYDYKIIDRDFDSDDEFVKIIALSDELSTLLQAGLTPDQEAALDDHLVDCLAKMVFGSNMIEKAGADQQLTRKLCQTILRGGEVTEFIEAGGPEYQRLKRELIARKLPDDTKAILHSRQEIVQHAKAASFIINELCMRGKDLTEDIMLQTHRILTYKTGTEDASWTQYSGVYCSVDVRAGLHQFPSPTLIRSKMRSMIRDLERDLEQANSSGEVDSIATVSKYCHTFVNIHPFLDCNRRICRLILNAIWLKFGGPIVCIGEHEDDRAKYEAIAIGAGILEDTYMGADEDEKPKIYKELASFILMHTRDSMRGLLQVVTSQFCRQKLALCQQSVNKSFIFYCMDLVVN